MAAFAFPAIDPVAFRLGPLAVRWYGLAYLACFLFAWWLLARLNKRWELGLSGDDEAWVMIAAVAGVVLGGRLGYVLVYGGPSYWQDPIRILQTWDGGMSFHGGLVGALLAGVLVSWRMKVPFLTLCDIGALAAPVGFGLGRIANFINDELWGRVTDVPWAVVFPNGGPLPRHPSQLYEAFLEGVVLLAVMWLLARKRRPAGELLGWLLIGYGVARIVGELFREPDVQLGFIFGGVTMGQILSVPMVIAGIALLAWVRARARAGTAPMEPPAIGSDG